MTLIVCRTSGSVGHVMHVFSFSTAAYSSDDLVQIVSDDGRSTAGIDNITTLALPMVLFVLSFR